MAKKASAARTAKEHQSNLCDKATYSPGHAQGEYCDWCGTAPDEMPQKQCHGAHERWTYYD